MRLRLYIDCNNAAFGDLPGAEVARILRKLADDLQENCAEELAMAENTLRDFNGNSVGAFNVVEGNESAPTTTRGRG